MRAQAHHLPRSWPCIRHVDFHQLRDLPYYDVFEQSLAAVNIARMRRPGGLLLTNNRVCELPQNPLSEIRYLDIVYRSLPGIGEPEIESSGIRSNKRSDRSNRLSMGA